jgi:AsmA protein
MKRTIIKVFKIAGLSVAAILLLLFLTPILFPGTVAEKIKTWTNSSLDGELNFSKVRLSFLQIIYLAACTRKYYYSAVANLVKNL